MAKKYDFWIRMAALAILLASITGCTPTTIDPYSGSYDFQSIMENSGIDKETLANGLYNNFKKSDDKRIKGENFLILGRITGEPRFVDVASDYFSKSEEMNEEKGSREERALLYETLASLLGSKYYHAKAAWHWKILNNEFRYKLNKDLALGNEPQLAFDTEPLQPSLIKTENPKSIKIGESDILLSKDDVLVSQADRVTRDWLSYQIQNPESDSLLSLFSESLSYKKEDLMPEIGWHEGARIKEMKSVTGLKHVVATGTILAKKDGKWYAPNENGVFMFEVPEDKVNYPTTRPFGDNLAMAIDTHGINMIVEQAIRNKATVAIGSCDHPEKAKAAKYLSDRGIKVICNTDRYVPLLIGSGANVLGSAPFEKTDGKIIIGNRPTEIKIGEPIVASDVDSKKYGVGYYDTPTRYFKELERSANIKLNLHIVNITDFNQQRAVIDKAEEVDANIIGVRIFNENDYLNVKLWLQKDINHKAILFHSEPYPYGYILAREFIAQTSFDDVNPVIL
ncbi:MAG: hypothetical protein AABY09_00560 [Nanoarchaeota archaeon]